MIHPDSMQERLEGLYSLANQLSALHTPEVVWKTAVDHCLQLTGSQFGFIGLISDDGSYLDVVSIKGFDPAPQFYKENRMMLLRPNLFSRVITENHPIRSADATQDERRVGQPDKHPPVYTYLGVPLRIDGEPIGMIGVANRPTPYEDEHEQLLLAYAAQVAIATQNAQLIKELREVNLQLESQVALQKRVLVGLEAALTRRATQINSMLAETVGEVERELNPIAKVANLSSDETQILRLLASGASNKMVADKLFISPTTLKRKLRSIQDKMGVDTRIEAVAAATQQGLI